MYAHHLIVGPDWQPIRQRIPSLLLVLLLLVPAYSGSAKDDLGTPKAEQLWFAIQKEMTQTSTKWNRLLRSQAHLFGTTMTPSDERIWLREIQRLSSLWTQLFALASSKQFADRKSHLVRILQVDLALFEASKSTLLTAFRIKSRSFLQVSGEIEKLIQNYKLLTISRLSRLGRAPRPIKMPELDITLGPGIDDEMMAIDKEFVTLANRFMLEVRTRGWRIGTSMDPRSVQSSLDPIMDEFLNVRAGLTATLDRHDRMTTSDYARSGASLAQACAGLIYLGFLWDDADVMALGASCKEVSLQEAKAKLEMLNAAKQWHERE